MAESTAILRQSLFGKNKNIKKIVLSLWVHWHSVCASVTGGTGHSFLFCCCSLSSLAVYVWWVVTPNGGSPWASDRGPLSDHHKGCTLWPALIDDRNQSLCKLKESGLPVLVCRRIKGRKTNGDGVWLWSSSTVIWFRKWLVAGFICIGKSVN